MNEENEQESVGDRVGDALEAVGDAAQNEKVKAATGIASVFARLGQSIANLFGKKKR